MAREIQQLGQAVDHPMRPFATVIGGGKVSSKIAVLETLLNRVDVLVIGGAMAFTFLRAQGKQLGKSLVEADRVEFCRALLEKAKSKGVQIVLPVDLVCAREIKAGADKIIVDVDHVPLDQIALDLGPKTSLLIDQALSNCRTVLWNGPLGVFETEGFERATFHLIDTLVALTTCGVTTIAGGGDSVSALSAKSVSNQSISHVSTGGGAAIEFIQGLELPGVACLDDA